MPALGVLSRGVGRLAGVLVLCVLALGLWAGRAAALPPASYYGANIQPIFEKGFVPQSDWNGLIADMSADSLQTARMDAIWAWVEPNAPVDGVHTYTWNPANDPTQSMDGLVGMLASNGVRMIATLGSPPTWAGGFSMTPAYYGDFVAFAQAFAARYGAGGTFWAQNPQLPYLPVQQLEIWGEANSSNFWTGSADPAAYVQVLQPLSAAVHAVDPSAQILAAIGWENAASYVGQLYQLGVQGSIDGIGFHPYAPDTPSIVGLVQQMRSALVSSGDPNLPIYVTETGVPAVPTSPGDTSEDAARAAMLSLAGDALAHSDCNSQSFDIYALVGSGTNLEPIDEGYMGMLDYMTGAPNITGSAIIAASQRWQADPSSGLVLCGSGSTPASALLPLGLSVTHTSPTCVSGDVTYYGNPLEAAQLVLRTADGRVAPATTNSAGQTQMCLQNGPAITSFTVYAELSAPATPASFVTPDIAQSPTYTCAVSVTSVPPCAETSSMTTTTSTTSTTTTHQTGGAGVSGSTGTAHSSKPTAAAAGCRLSAAILRIAGKRTTLHARLACARAKQPTVRLEVWLQRRGKRTRTLLARVTLAKGRWQTFTIRAVPRAGDRVTAEVPANKSARLPTLTVTITATEKLLRDAAHGSRR